jgi:glycosyltransferase involved in cell wall biosynthesis
MKFNYISFRPEFSLYPASMVLMVKAQFTSRSAIATASADAVAPAAPATAGANVAGQVIFLGAGPQMQCGVGHFTQGLSDAFERLDPGIRVDIGFTQSSGTLAEFWRALRGARAVICNFPIVGWKRVVFRPLLALALARLRGRRVVMVQHEWDSLNRARRWTYLPALLLANTIVTFSPLVKRQLAADPVVGWRAGRCVLAPLPPNIAAPLDHADSPLRQQLAAARRSGRLVVGHFGSIYPGKQPEAVLSVGAALKRGGHNPLLVYIGSFIRGVDRVEEPFHARVKALGMESDVIVSGFVASNAEMFGLFDEVDVFCYQLSEGLTARRASIIAAAQSGKPIVVTAPADVHEFDHHPRFRDLIAQGAILLVPRGATDEDYGRAIVAAVRQPPHAVPFDFDAWWRDTAKAIYAEI